MTHHIARYFGTLTGLSPTNDSRIGLGEIEIKIDATGIKIRLATGFAIREASIPLQNVRTLPSEEVQKQFMEGTDLYTRYDGFQIGEGMILLFLRNPAKAKGFWFWRTPAEVRLIVKLGGLAEVLGPTLLYDEVQVAAGDFEYLIKQAGRRIGPYPLPRLKFEGFHEPSPN